VGTGIAIDSHPGRGAIGAAGPEAALAEPAARDGSGSGGEAAAGRRAPGARHVERSADGHRGPDRSTPRRSAAIRAEDAPRLGSSGEHGGRQAPVTAREGGGLDGRREGGDSRQGGSGAGGGTSGEGGDHGGLNPQGDSASGDGGGGDGSAIDGGSSGDGSGSDGGSSGSGSSGSDHEGEILEGEHEGSSGSIEETSTQATGTFDGTRDSRISDGLSP
jgi:hypothetical protein